jgi:GxxExxY protein
VPGTTIEGKRFKSIVTTESTVLNCDLRFDLMVENQVIIEIKAVDYLMPVHEAQLLTYLKLMGKPKGVLLNFNCANLFREGQKTLVTKLYGSLPFK